MQTKEYSELLCFAVLEACCLEGICGPASPDSANAFLQHCPENLLKYIKINPLTPELNPSAQRYLVRYFTGDFYF
jgi:hypothetical protein